MFQFYSVPRSCLACRSKLLTATKVSAQTLQGPLARMGITCYCISCNRRYRGTSRFPAPLLTVLGPLGRWLWWRTASLELTLQPEQF